MRSGDADSTNLPGVAVGSVIGTEVPLGKQARAGMRWWGRQGHARP